VEYRVWDSPSPINAEAGYLFSKLFKTLNEIPIMADPEASHILEEFNSRKPSSELPSKRSNRAFLGHIFATIALKHLAKHVSPQYEALLGPLWIKGLEWVEWDGAVVRKGSRELFEKYYHPDDVIALFEFKSSGIYGRKHPQKDKGKTVEEVVEDIRKNFDYARKLCPNLNGCFYISLHERVPRHERKPDGEFPINYYEETKKLGPDITTCVLFDSYSIEKNKPKSLDDWDTLVKELEKLQHER
jgi:hypothetical protein